MDGKTFGPWPWLPYSPSYVAYYNRQSSASSGSPMSSKYRQRQQQQTTPNTTNLPSQNSPGHHYHSHANNGAQQRMNIPSYSNAHRHHSSTHPHHHHVHHSSPSNPYHPFSIAAYQQHHAATANLMQHQLAATYSEQSRRKLGDVSNRLHTWKALSIAISLLALILLTCKLYDVDREIQFLQHVADEWLSPVAIQKELQQHHHFHRNPLSSSSSSSLPSSSSSSLISSSSSLPHAQALTSPSMVSGGHLNITVAAATSRPTGRSNLYSNGQSHTVPNSLHSHSYSHSAQQHYGTFQPQHLPLSLVKGSTLNDVTNVPKQAASTSNNHNKIQQLRDQQAEQQRVLFLLESLREDVDSLVVELWSSRTTLVLSLIFVGVYIMSWCWMAYAIRETAAPHEVSLKTVLLLAIFAAVDIAASAGFVMVRIIMYVMRDYYFPRDMRSPDLTAEYQQLAAFAALRLVILKSSTSVVDVFVSIIVGFLTSLRVYSVICAVSFYRRARRELLNINNLEMLMEKTRTSPRTSPVASSGNGRKFELPFSSSSNLVQKSRMLNAHRDLERRFSLADTPGSSLDSDKSAAGVDDSTPLTSGDPASELKIQAADMPPTMQKSAMQATIHALRAYSTEKHIAESVKQAFDQLFEPTWHCIVGRNWGSCVTHTKSNYIRMLYKDLTILLYKSS